MNKMIGYSKMPEPPNNHWDCYECQDKGELKNGDACTECCPHDEREHGSCLDCGDFQEDWGSREADALYDQWKDSQHEQ